MQVSKWYVVLNGQLKLVRESESEKFYHVGDRSVYRLGVVLTAAPYRALSVIL